MTQQNTQIAGFPDVWGGRSRAVPVDHQGPASYVAGGEVFPTQSVYGGPNSLGLAGVLWCSGGTTESGNYDVVPIFGGGGKIAGTIKLKWQISGGAGNGVTSVTGSGGSGMTVAPVALAFSGGGGSGAAGTLTVLTATTFSIKITNPGSGYTSAPTVTAATGGTPPTLTATIGGVAGLEVPAATNLSAEVIRLLVIGG